MTTPSFANHSPWQALVDRQFGYSGFTADLHEAIARTRAVVIGAGGNGAVLDLLVRSGFTRFVIIDPDMVEDTNLNRLPFGRDSIGLPKVEAWKRHLLGINPGCEVLALEQALDRRHAGRLEELLADGPSLVFLGSTNVEANLVAGRAAARLGVRLLIGPASSGCLVVSTFTHDNGLDVERLGRFGTENTALEDIDFSSLGERYREALAFPGRKGKLEPGVWEAMATGALPARSCGMFVCLVNAAMAFEAVKNVAALHNLPLPGGRLFAIPEVLIFDPWTGRSFVFNALTGSCRA